MAIIRQGRGHYVVLPSGSAGPYETVGGDVQVSAVGTTDDRCYIEDWDQQQLPLIYVNCLTSHGGSADSAFTVQWVVPDERRADDDRYSCHLRDNCRVRA